MEECVVGVDLGATFTKCGVVARDGRLLAYSSIPTDSTLPYRTFFKQLCLQIEELVESIDDEVTVKGIGVGAPTGNYFSGTIENASNLDWSGQVPVVEVLESYSNLPTVLTNDANAAAVGEMLYGAAKGLKNFICITLGTGLGCGIVANGKLVVGHNGHAGEIGHTTVYFDGRPCKCGRLGCLETYVSAPGVVHTVQELMRTTERESKLREISDTELNAEKITQAARQNDQLALEAFAYTGRILGLKLADIVASVNPEVIIMTGGLSKAGALILDPAKKCMEEHMLSVFKNGVDIFQSTLSDKNAAILGAAALVWNELENKQEIENID